MSKKNYEKEVTSTENFNLIDSRTVNIKYISFPGQHTDLRFKIPPRDEDYSQSLSTIFLQFVSPTFVNYILQNLHSKWISL